MRLIVVVRLVLLSAPLMLVGCSQTTRTLLEGISGAPFCSVAEPITYSRKDTPETAKMIREHNAVGIELCGWGKKE